MHIFGLLYLNVSKYLYKVNFFQREARDSAWYAEGAEETEDVEKEEVGENSEKVGEYQEVVGENREDVGENSKEDAENSEEVDQDTNTTHFHLSLPLTFIWLGVLSSTDSVHNVVPQFKTLGDSPDGAIHDVRWASGRLSTLTQALSMREGQPVGAEPHIAIQFLELHVDHVHSMTDPDYPSFLLLK